MKKKLYLFLALALPVQWAGLKLAANHPIWVEQFYSDGVFPIISNALRRVFGLFPFSVGDILYLLVGIVLLRWFYRRIKTRFRHPVEWLLQMAAYFSVVYFLFHFCWGLNYYRPPLHENLDLKDTYTTQELIDLTEQFIAKTNRSLLKITNDRDQPVHLDRSFSEIKNELGSNSGNALDSTTPLMLNFNSIKPSLISLPLTYMGFSGYLNPWTNEAQVNSKLPSFRLPAVMAHELGHQLGYAKENEANFIAALATLHHPNPYFEYSGASFALQYTLADLRKRDPKAAKSLIDQLYPGVLKNYEESNAFWRAHENPLEPVFKGFYGNYLKINNQPGGMKSYSYVVALLVNYYKDHNLNE